MPRMKVLMEIKGQLPKAKKLQTPSTHRNPNKFFLYHHDYSQDIKECIQLQDEIEELIR